MSSNSDKENLRLDGIYRIFIRWYAMPSIERDPPSLDGFREKYKITKQNLSEFARRPEYTQDLYLESLKWGKSKIPELLGVLYQRYLKDQDPADLRLYNEILKGDKKDVDKDTETTDGVLRALFEKSKS